ncbi:MAG: TonB-dependent receptor domain-containing protein [Phaeodactylibacter xiamenensis]|uniref:TonB-dependent receptor n=1 Tax=Phaeodactylibacter xiamenensis TaxID=1524460 RepID=A0A098S4J7_9BACT|nr:TonB-dependent receptor [Phaeodactylibacter xiamenensis]KGE87070.1 TonB-dependent receptor [Phaeodactylibacter xiamenensis]MCR9050760.1 TonB-dependent receptor [bacterium]
MRQILTILFVLTVYLVTAQTGTIRGTVIEDESGFTVIGANVLVKDTDRGTVTDLDGEFSISIAPGTYSVQISYIGFQTLTIADVEVVAGEVNALGEIRLGDDTQQLQEVVVTGKAIRTTEAALMTIKKKAPAMLDGISSARMQLTGDATAVEAAKRVTGVSIEGGKYVYVRGLGDRYSKTTLNGVDIPGLDPDRNTIQMDIFPTNLIDNLVVSKNFTADMPADFTGGLLNIETKDFPEERILSASVSLGYNPQMNLTNDFLTYDGGDTDFLGFDDGARALPVGADAERIPTPISGNTDREVGDFIRSFNPELGANRETSLLDYSASFSIGNQFDLNNQREGKLGYIFSLSYRNDYTYYDDVFYGEYQRVADPADYELIYANDQFGQLGEQNILIGGLAGLAYKTKLSKYRFTAMRLQNGENRAGKFTIDNNGDAVGQSGYIALSDNLEYNQRSLSNFLLNGTHVLGESGWEIDWRGSMTISSSDDPDIRKTAFTVSPVDTNFVAGAGGNPSRIWRYLDETNTVGRLDITKNYTFRGENAKLKFGGSHTFKERDYEILFYDIQFFGGSTSFDPIPNDVLVDENIFPTGNIYYQSGNNTPNPNEYNSTVNNTAFYVSNEADLLPNLKTIFGVRAENFVQRHTGRDQRFASGDPGGNNLENEAVLDDLDFFPSVNLIYSLQKEQNLRAAYSRTIARPSFKELSFAQIIDPVTNRIFNGSLFSIQDWDGNLVATRIDNIDLRWELFMEGGQIFSISGFYKRFDQPIELVRLPQAATSAEFQPRNVGNGQLFGLEFEVRKKLNFISPALENFSFSGNVTVVESQIDMTNAEFNNRQLFEREGQTIENTRQMAGQAPYVINAGITYGNLEKGIDAGLFYNVKGETLEIVGTGLYPDVFFQPFHSLNFSFNKKLGAEQNTTLDFGINNILNDKVESFYQSFEATPQVFNRVNPGVSVSVGISHNF